MLKLGERQTLTVEKTAPMGVFLRDPADGEEGEHVLLPRKQVPENAKPGDSVDVFLYKDSEDRIIATVHKPLLMLHEVGWLTVREVGRVGAFLDWGLEKDLLLPFHEQPRQRVQKGQKCLVAVYLDKSERLCATMNVYPYLRTDSPYRKGDEVEGTVYETSDNFGLFVAVDDIYSALIPKKELVRDLAVGDHVHARITQVRADGKLDLSLRENAYAQMGPDADRILEALKRAGGGLDFTDKADPALIRSRMQMSKNEFKRAVGRLLKERKIEIADGEIRLR
jgi:predicted RNA-binding protein (virulence factor B family)